MREEGRGVGWRDEGGRERGRVEGRRGGREGGRGWLESEPNCDTA